MPVKPYTTTRIKTRNYLSNVAFNGVVQEDPYNRNFVFDISVLITKNLNHFSLKQKVADQNKHKMIYMLWKKWMPVENFLYLNGKNMLHTKTRSGCLYLRMKVIIIY